MSWLSLCGTGHAETGLTLLWAHIPFIIIPTFPHSAAREFRHRGPCFFFFVIFFHLSVWEPTHFSFFCLAVLITNYSSCYVINSIWGNDHNCYSSSPILLCYFNCVCFKATLINIFILTVDQCSKVYCSCWQTHSRLYTVWISGTTSVTYMKKGISHKGKTPVTNVLWRRMHFGLWL